MLVIGLTGGIASGKSRVAAFLKEKGAWIINADTVGREIVRPGLPPWEEIVRHFGPGVLTGSGEIDRGLLGSLVFSRPDRLEQLNRITHPRIAREIQDRIAAIRQEQPRAVVVVEAAVLLEAGWEGLVDQVWLVVAGPGQQVERGLARGDLNREELVRRIQAQAAPGELTPRAHQVIDNSGPWERTEAALEVLWEDARDKAEFSHGS